MLYLPPYAINNRLRRAWLKSVNFQVGHGFRARRSCETQLLETLDDITKRAANNKQIDIILLEFSKA
jgi:hypothetical protein